MGSKKRKALAFILKVCAVDTEPHMDLHLLPRRFESWPSLIEFFSDRWCRLNKQII